MPRALKRGGVGRQQPAVEREVESDTVALGECRCRCDAGQLSEPDPLRRLSAIGSGELGQRLHPMIGGESDQRALRRHEDRERVQESTQPAIETKQVVVQLPGVGPYS